MPLVLKFIRPLYRIMSVYFRAVWLDRQNIYRKCHSANLAVHFKFLNMSCAGINPNRLSFSSRSKLSHKLGRKVRERHRPQRLQPRQDSARPQLLRVRLHGGGRRPHPGQGLCGEPQESAQECQVKVGRGRRRTLCRDPLQERLEAETDSVLPHPQLHPGQDRPGASAGHRHIHLGNWPGSRLLL